VWIFTNVKKTAFEEFSSERSGESGRSFGSSDSFYLKEIVAVSLAGTRPGDRDQSQRSMMLTACKRFG
jgi:hypothetical protein